MTPAQRQEAKARMMAAIRRGQPWDMAAHGAGLRIGRATAYRWRRRARAEGDTALRDQRRGWATKLRGPVHQWLADYCRGAPHSTGSLIQGVYAQTPDFSASPSRRPVFRENGRYTERSVGFPCAASQGRCSQTPTCQPSKTGMFPWA